LARAEDIESVVGLFRVSTEIQEREGYSLQAQERAYARDCRAYGWRSLATFEGHETGSALTQRQTIHDLIAFIQTNHPDAIWVIEQSRLTRGDELDVAMLIRELRETGTKVATERGNVTDPADLEGAFVFRFKALMDRREWEVIAARNKRGKDEKAKRGLNVNGRPAYGYKVEGEGRNKGLRVPVPAEAEVVRQIFEWAVAGLSIRKIIRRLHEQAVPAPTQSGRISGTTPRRFKDGLQVWSATTIKRMLRNPIYLGVSYRHCWIKQGKTHVFDPTNPEAIWVENAHEPIVSQEQWDAAHGQLARRKTETHTDVHMLTGILVCPLCGNGFRVTSSNDQRGHKNTYYYCNSKRNVVNEFGEQKRTASACSMRWLPLEKTDLQIWGAFVVLISSPQMIEQYLASAGAEKHRKRLRDEISRLEESAAKIETMMSRAREKLLTEILTDGEYLKERERLDTQLHGTQKRLLTKQTELKSTSKDAARQVIQSLAMLRLGEKKLSRDQRSRLFHSLVKRVVPADVDMKRVEIEMYLTTDTIRRKAKVPELPGSGVLDVAAVSMRLPIDQVAAI
jgi:site-specific DNA recombinase